MEEGLYHQVIGTLELILLISERDSEKHHTTLSNTVSEFIAIIKSKDVPLTFGAPAKYEGRYEGRYQGELMCHIRILYGLLINYIEISERYELEDIRDCIKKVLTF